MFTRACCTSNVKLNSGSGEGGRLPAVNGRLSPMGWTFVILGLTTAAIGTFMVYYGRDLIRSPVVSSQAGIERPTLAPEQERTLELLVKYQKKFATNKLIIGRKTGKLHFDGDPEKGKEISLVHELYGVGIGDVARAAQFEKLLESMPPDYVRFYGESRFDNPFVISVTEAGMKYLRSN